MTRWERFKHAFETCCGPESKREYRPPHGAKIEGRDPRVVPLIEEGLYGVTLIHHRCSTCGRRFVNRELGDLTEEKDAA